MDNAISRAIRRKLYKGLDTRIPEGGVRTGPSPGDTRLLGHICQTHASLRMMIGFIALAFPFLLWGIGKFRFGLEMPGSMSEFYWAPYRPYQIDAAFAGGYLVGDAPVRVFLVGGLYAMGVFMIGYRGYAKGENRLHTLAGLCAVMVATFPMNPCGELEPVCAIERLGNVLYGHERIHAGSACLLFLFLCVAIICYSKITLQYFGNERFKRYFQGCYYVLAGCMVVLPLLAIAMFNGYVGSLGLDDRTKIYWIEIGAFIPFGAFWLIKTFEIHLSEYDIMLTIGMTPPDPEPAPQ